MVNITRTDMRFTVTLCYASCYERSRLRDVLVWYDGTLQLLIPCNDFVAAVTPHVYRSMMSACPSFVQAIGRAVERLREGFAAGSGSPPNVRVESQEPLVV